MADEDFLRRWARRKSQAREGVEPPPSPPAPAAAASVASTAAAPAAATVTPPSAAPVPPAPLPDPASLEPGADISAFMSKNVDDLLRRKALKTLFSDPRYNVMDRMDVYIDDYSIPDPLPPDWLDKLEQVTHLGDKAGRDREEAERQAALEAQAKAEADADTDTDAGIAAASESSVTSSGGTRGSVSEVPIDEDGARPVNDTGDSSTGGLQPSAQN